MFLYLSGLCHAGDDRRDVRNLRQNAVAKP
jgi:hypothetical protein